MGEISRDELVKMIRTARVAVVEQWEGAYGYVPPDVAAAIADAILARLAAKDEAEPVAWRYHYGDGNWRLTQDEPINIRTMKECAVESLYATSPTAAKDEARERVIADDAINGVEAIAKLREFDRFALVIESAVRNADAPNLPRVSDLLKRTRVFMSIMGPKSLSPSNPRRMQGEEE